MDRGKLSREGMQKGKEDTQVRASHQHKSLWIFLPNLGCTIQKPDSGKNQNLKQKIKLQTDLILVAKSGLVAQERRVRSNRKA